MASVAVAWLICAYALFDRLLHVDLPKGKLFS
jgi:hypothetical protein